ncbi:lipopolysaccharide biosynthesis protein [Pseudoflavonifractor sp. 524-17]|uniref:lipopolysaccharide biosynthesis protein n=1 Tax=Pseudoflavonifractor sp. 524-17 TaxID=2304577 RepID=UPI00192A624B|nr:lipopolysaccharide biosynthesis protein [Pseudoflavonifractor sp. 524-17]
MIGKRGAKKDTQERSRAEYSAINATVAMVTQGISVVVAYAGRVVFTHTLSQSYAGINGLFTDILGILALSELGIASAMNYALYRPAAQNDIPKIQAVMKLYKRLYLGVAAFVAVIGLGMLPFLHHLAGDLSAIEHLKLIYLLYLGNSVVSYLLTYKWSVITAYQREYIVSLWSTTFFVIRVCIQMAVLLITKNYIAYLLVIIIGTILCNVYICRQAERMYPYLREKNDNELPREEKQEISRNIRALALHRLGAVVINNTDNLLLSRLTGIVNVAIYSNYYLIISSVRQVLDRIFQGIAASVGNLGTTEDRDELEPVFYTAFFTGQWIYSLAAICLYELLCPFIALSFGTHYLFGRSTVLLLCVLLFLQGMRKTVTTFWYALGMFWLDRYKALAEAVLNLVISILLGVRYGVNGIFMGTVLSMLLVPVWMEPYLFFRHCLKKPLGPFIRKYAVYLAVITLTWWLVDTVCGLVTGGMAGVLILRFVICVLTTNGVFLLAHVRRQEFKSMVWLASSLVKRKRGDNKSERSEKN